MIFSKQSRLLDFLKNHDAYLGKNTNTNERIDGKFFNKMLSVPYLKDTFRDLVFRYLKHDILITIKTHEK